MDHVTCVSARQGVERGWKGLNGWGRGGGVLCANLLVTRSLGLRAGTALGGTPDGVEGRAGDIARRA